MIGCCIPRTEGRCIQRAVLSVLPTGNYAQRFSPAATATPPETCLAAVCGEGSAPAPLAFRVWSPTTQPREPRLTPGSDEIHRARSHVGGRGMRNAAPRRPGRLCMTLRQQQPLKQLIKWELQSDKELAELGKTCAHLVEAHLVNDRFHFKDIVRKQRNSPFPII